jgi:hypothetical protein
MEHKRLDRGCPCQVRIKLYPHTSTILGRYTPDHSHPTRKDNLKHIRICVPAREQLIELIRLGLMDKEIVRDTYLILTCLIKLSTTEKVYAHSIQRA